MVNLAAVLASRVPIGLSQFTTFPSPFLVSCHVALRHSCSVRARRTNLERADRAFLAYHMILFSVLPGTASTDARTAIFNGSVVTLQLTRKAQEHVSNADVIWLGPVCRKFTGRVIRNKYIPGVCECHEAC